MYEILSVGADGVPSPTVTVPAIVVEPAHERAFGPDRGAVDTVLLANVFARWDGHAWHGTNVPVRMYVAWYGAHITDAPLSAGEHVQAMLFPDGLALVMRASDLLVPMMPDESALTEDGLHEWARSGYVEQGSLERDGVERLRTGMTAPMRALVAHGARSEDLLW